MYKLLKWGSLHIYIFFLCNVINLKMKKQNHFVYEYYYYYFFLEKKK